jgi:light-harvesting complex I chlorophyll a/b binding protein 4
MASPELLPLSPRSSLARYEDACPLRFPALTSLTATTTVALASFVCYQGPFGIFDPLGLAPESVDELRLYREAELAHGRVAMVASLGFLVQEGFHPMFDVNVPVIRQLDEVLKFSNGMLGGSCLLMAIMFAEINRARIGWVEPEVKLPILTEEVQANIVSGGRWNLRDGYLPGDLGFDPLGMKPTDRASLLSMQDKELNNGRLAMIAVAGMTAQELVTGSTLF